MTAGLGLVGRDRDLQLLEGALRGAAEGRGSLLLVAGEAGVGKTALVQAAAGTSGLLVLEASSPLVPAPYAPIVAALRGYRRLVPEGLRDCGGLAPHLGAILPELGPAPDDTDGATLAEAIRCAFEEIAAKQATAVFFDDLQWADEATLELLPRLSVWLSGESVLLIGAYRSDELARGHPLRRLRAELRRAGAFGEVVVEPLGRADAGELAARMLGRRPGVRLARTIYDRTQGLPFFVEELVATLAASSRLVQRGDRVELAGGEKVPVPATVRDAVLLRAEALSPRARRALELAAIAGLRFELELVAEVGGGEGLDELLQGGFVVEVERGVGAFRHALLRDALYADIPWTRRRADHRAIAEELERRHASPELLAEHWFGAGAPERARPALLTAAESFSAVHAYRDAAGALERALEQWPDGEDEGRRLAALERLSRCAELAGELAEAARALEEVAEQRRVTGEEGPAAEAERRLANVYELQGAWERALSARERAADAFAAHGRLAEAVVERLAAAAHLQSAGSLTAALDLVCSTAADADRLGDAELRARVLALEGQVRAKLGEGEQGVALAREGLALALAAELSSAAAEAYYRLASALEHASRYPAALDAYGTAFEFCRERGIEGMAEVCFACLAPVMVRTGEWARAEQVCREVLEQDASPAVARMVAAGELGLVLALRGQARRARRLLGEALAFSRRAELFGLEIDAVHGLTRLGDSEAAADRMRSLVERCLELEERHYAVTALRWGSTLFARHGDSQGAAACADALSRIAAASGQTETLAALSHALGEVVLLDGEADAAVLHFERALELLAELTLPFERAETQLRSGVAYAASGERDAAVERLTACYRTARNLRARPLASQAIEELAALGEKVERHFGRRAAGELERGGLSRRELEVVRLVAVGRTNREIARELFLSPRTVDMHVRNILARLDCRSRADASRRAAELGLLEHV